MKRAIIFLNSLGMLGCSPASNQIEEKTFLIDGKWFSNDFYTSYLSLSFGERAVFDNVGDTINVFSYSVDYSTHTLWLTDAFGQTRSASMLKLDADSLVFNHLWDLKAVQRFHKSKKK